MDKNKAIKLREINYKIRGNCGSCIYSIIEQRKAWGVCTHYVYFHEKHENFRALSIHKDGFCTMCVWKSTKLHTALHFEEFYE